MKGRILFALVFAALIALGITTFGEMHSQSAALPPAQKTAVYIAALPADLSDAPPVPSQVASVARAHTQITTAAPVLVKFFDKPPLLQSYHLAFYQAFHFSDRAG